MPAQVLPDLEREYEEVMRELEQEQAEVAEIENSDQDYLNELKASIAEQKYAHSCKLHSASLTLEQRGSGSASSGGSRKQRPAPMATRTAGGPGARKATGEDGYCGRR